MKLDILRRNVSLSLVLGKLVEQLILSAIAQNLQDNPGPGLIRP